MTGKSGEHTVEEPTTDVTRRAHDPLWVAVGNLGSNVAEHGKRIEKVETRLEETHLLATTAVTKIDALTLKEIETQKQFTSAVNDKTVAVESLDSSTKVLGTWMKAMALGFIFLALVNTAVLLAILLGWPR